MRARWRARRCPNLRLYRTVDAGGMPTTGSAALPAAKATRAAASATVRTLIRLFLAGLVVTCTAVDARLRVEVDCLRAAERANAHDERVGAQKLRTRPEQRRCHRGREGGPPRAARAPWSAS